MFVAMEIHHTTSVVKYYGSGSNKLPSVSLNKMSFESFIRDLLLVKRYRLEIYRNNSKFKQGNDWIVAYKASPGNLHQLEDVIFTANSTGDSCIVIAIRLATVNGQRVVGVAFVDSSNYKLGVCQFTDNDNFSNIETLLVQLEPKECIIPANDVSSDANILRKTILRTNILITERKKAEFNEKDIIQDLNRLLKGLNNSATLR
jgi:DNA mismatch repair protein MSH2